MEEEYNSLLTNGNIRESVTGNLVKSECNSSLAHDGDGKSLMISAGLEFSNSRPNSVGYKGEHEVHEKAFAGNHLRNPTGSHSCVNNGLQLSTSSMPSYVIHRIKDAWECSSSPDADAAKSVTTLRSVRDICISILRDKLPTKESGRSQKLPPNDNETTPLFQCMGCKSLGNPLKMLICDCCEGGFHLSCCKPCVRKIPKKKWCCQICSRMRPKRQRNKLGPKHKPIQRPRRGLGTMIQDMLVDAELYQSGMRIGTNFQADVREWSGPTPSNEDQFVEPSELNPSEETTMMNRLQVFKDKQSIVSNSNWIQCREVLDTGIVCAKWRRAPLHVDQSSNWDCSCSVVWDPFHADCVVPQELETDEVLEQLKYVNKEDETLEGMTLQQYIDMYKQPLSKNSREAILKLTEVAMEKKKKKNKDKKDKKNKQALVPKEKVKKLKEKASEGAAA